MNKKILGIEASSRPHWVGDGFPVQTLFSYGTHGNGVSPFLMLDYAAPTEFKPSAAARGVGEHPHRGFETVTIVYQGELAHRDSTGQSGRIGTGDVQWMTAGAGILHDEFHSPDFTRSGGTMEMVQLWVNLPAKDKKATPGYQTLLGSQIPIVQLPGDAGSLRVIAGEFDGSKGPARTFTPIDVWDVYLKRDKQVTLTVPEGRTLLLVVLRGPVLVNGTEIARDAQLVTLDREGTGVTLEASGDAALLLLSGEPIDEPIAGYGPFVMNTDAEIHEAIDDFNAGKFGRMERVEVGSVQAATT
ncbi:MAG: yhhW 2 [Rhodospirillales bacterium]|nr:yhhW 2 [Rhodospirillales bacterium]